MSKPRVEVTMVSYGYHLHLRDVWRGPVAISADEAHALFEALGEQLGRTFGAASPLPGEGKP